MGFYLSETIDAGESLFIDHLLRLEHSMERLARTREHTERADIVDGKLFNNFSPKLLRFGAKSDGWF
jgi:hypothetical protein